jgi:hypothetical protein
VKLTDLDPRWYRHGGEDISDAAGNPIPERLGVGITFECPCGCPDRVVVPFANPLDGGTQPGDPKDPLFRTGWQRTGDTFETLTLNPSVQRIGGCGWHGWIRDGQAVTC